MGNRVSQYLRSNVLGLIAIFIALSGVSYAAQGGGGGGGMVKKNTVVSKSIKDGEVKTADLADNAATGAKVDESTLGTVPSADTATTATSADNATTADSASTATNATNASNADTLDNVDSSGFVKLGSTAQTGGFNVTGSSRIQDTIRQGSETGTTEAPNIFGSPVGVITRRVNSSSVGSTQIIARDDTMRMTRSTSNGDLRIEWSLSGSGRAVACSGVTNAGAAANFYVNIPTSAGGILIYNDSQSVVKADCMFGYPTGLGQMTNVDLMRFSGDDAWVGFVTSTYNQ